VAEVVFDITTTETELARKRGDATRLIREQSEQIASKRHQQWSGWPDSACDCVINASR